VTYIENALYDFFKTILTRGVRTLTDPKYLSYSIFLGIILITTTISAFIGDIPFLDITINNYQRDILLYVELSAAMSFIVVGLILGKLRTSLQMLCLIALTIALSAIYYLGVIPDTNTFATLLAAVLYIVWITIAAFSTFSLFRDLFENEVFGMVLFLGKPKDDGRPMFRGIAFILALLNIALGYYIYSNGTDQNSTALTYSGIIIILTALVAIIPLINLQRKYDVFFTILTTFYMFTTIRILILAFKSLTSSPGTTSVWDTLFSIFMALYAIQGAAVKGIKIGEPDSVELTVEERMMEEERGSLGFAEKLSDIIGEKGVVLLILGAVLGFHTMQVQSFLGRQNIFNEIQYTADADIVLLGYEVNLAVSLFIYIISIIGFILIPAFRTYANPLVRRVVWAPEYDDLKLLVFAFKDGDLDWKTESLKLAGSLSKNKLKNMVRGGSSMEDAFANSINGWVKKVNKDAKKELLDDTS